MLIKKNKTNNVPLDNKSNFQFKQSKYFESLNLLKKQICKIEYYRKANNGRCNGF